MSAAELVYFDGRGRSEIVRIVLTACGIKFTEVYLTSRDQFLKLRPTLPFGQVPLLRIDGKELVQSNAIVRHLARTHNLYGKSEEEMTSVDIFFEGSRDFLSAFMSTGFAFPVDKVKENTKEAVSKYLPFFDRILKNNGSNGHLVSSSLTFADLGLLEALLMISDYFEASVYDEYPEIKKFLKTMSEQAFHQAYLKGIRKPPNSLEYVANVKEVLAF